MGRRSIHTPDELRELIIEATTEIVEQVGLEGLSAREIAKRVGYSPGTLYNVFGTYDRLVLAINTETFRLWTRHLQDRLAEAGKDRIRALVEGYFSFARANRNLWMAIYDHRLPPGMSIPEEFLPDRSMLTNIVIDEVAAALPDARREQAPRLARSLIATVHGHCPFTLDGTFELMGIKEPEELALARVRDSLAAA